MRWVLLLLLTRTASMAAAVAPLPEIKTGTHPQPIEIWETPWYPGFISTSVAFLVGEVGDDATSGVQTTPQQTVMWEKCDVSVESAFGHLEQIEGIKTAKLICSQEGSPYVPVDPEWGRIRHLKKGQRILILLYEHEGASFGHEAIIELTAATRTLPEILRRTAFDPLQFTDEDWVVVEAASSILHDQLLEIRTLRREMNEEESREHMQTAMTIAAMLGATIVLVFVVLRFRHKRREDSPSQNPTT